MARPPFLVSRLPFLSRAHCSRSTGNYRRIHGTLQAFAGFSPEWCRYRENLGLYCLARVPSVSTEVIGMSAKTVTINRAPVLTLWATVVAERIGFDRDEALSLGKTVAGLNAQAKGRRLGIYTPKQEDIREAKRQKRGASGNPWASRSKTRCTRATQKTGWLGCASEGTCRIRPSPRPSGIRAGTPGTSCRKACSARGDRGSRPYPCQSGCGSAGRTPV